VPNVPKTIGDGPMNIMAHSKNPPKKVWAYPWSNYHDITLGILISSLNPKFYLDWPLVKKKA
jgi:hypothetical protein